MFLSASIKGADSEKIAFGTVLLNRENHLFIIFFQGVEGHGVGHRWHRGRGRGDEERVRPGEPGRVSIPRSFVVPWFHGTLLAYL